MSRCGLRSYSPVGQSSPPSHLTPLTPNDSGHHGGVGVGDGRRASSRDHMIRHGDMPCQFHVLPSPVGLVALPRLFVSIGTDMGIGMRRFARPARVAGAAFTTRGSSGWFVRRATGPLGCAMRARRRRRRSGRRAPSVVWSLCLRGARGQRGTCRPESPAALRCARQYVRPPVFLCRRRTAPIPIRPVRSRGSRTQVQMVVEVVSPSNRIPHVSRRCPVPETDVPNPTAGLDWT